MNICKVSEINRVIHFIHNCYLFSNFLVSLRTRNIILVNRFSSYVYYEKIQKVKLFE